MEPVREKIRNEINHLIQEGEQFLAGFRDPGDSGNESRTQRFVGVLAAYQAWYSRALPVVRQLLPDRLDEFVALYKGNKKIKSVDPTDYGVDDYLLGHRVQKVTMGLVEEDAFDHEAVVYMRVQQQVAVFKSAIYRLDDILTDITGVLQAKLFDSNVDAARHLLLSNHLRAAGAVAEVVLEEHLGAVAGNHSVKLRKKAPHISDWNDALKQDSVFDVPVWRQIQRFGDIRNLCDHKKEREPTKDEVTELIDGVEKLIKTLV